VYSATPGAYLRHCRRSRIVRNHQRANRARTQSPRTTVKQSTEKLEGASQRTHGQPSKTTHDGDEMAHRGLRQYPVLQCTFGLFLVLAGFANNATAQVQPPIDPTRITEVPADEGPKPCPHYSSEVVKLHRGRLFFPTPNSMKIGDGQKYPSAVQVIFDSIQFQNDAGTDPRVKDRRVLLYMDCASQDTPPELDNANVIWSYRATLQLPEFSWSGLGEDQLNVGSVKLNVTGNGTLVDFLEPYNGMEVILRLVEEPEGVNRLLMRDTVLKVILPDRRK
jgi:hypothetical protein